MTNDWLVSVSSSYADMYYNWKEKNTCNDKSGFKDRTSDPDIKNELNGVQDVIAQKYT